MSSSSSPCAACKLQRRKCTPECIFAPYFPADQPQKFAYIHKVFGASNVAKLLNELSIHQREDAAQSLAYEAETRLRDPVYGCVGLISILQQKLKLLQSELGNARKELATYIGPQAMLPMIPAAHQAGPSGPLGLHMGTAGPSSSSWALAPYIGEVPLPPHHQVAGPLAIHEQQQIGFDPQGQQEIYCGLRQQQDIKLNGLNGLDSIMPGSGYDHPDAGMVLPSLDLKGTFECAAAAAYQIQQPGDSQGNHQHPDQHHHGQNNFQAHLSLPPQHPHGIVHHEQQEQQGSGGDEHKSCAEGPSC